MDEIAEWMRSASVTQAAAAEVLHVTCPRVSDVVNHKVEKFTIDAIVRVGSHWEASAPGRGVETLDLDASNERVLGAFWGTRCKYRQRL